ncbi:DNA-binding transcriptional repressor DeoR [Pasteurella sp. PK-2025]|uniref:DNA-binding transcriptional repressor DeoR n=1 Tax=unclassified Pasteurella TaxID=2621516 RepID=UPI003C71E7E3
MDKLNSRVQKLEFLLKQMDKIHLRDAAEILNVSEMTIRRDLNANSGSIQLLGGYIVRDPQGRGRHGYQIFEHQDKNIAEKMQVGKDAAALVQEGDVVFFDCGSTIPFVVSQIDPSIKFTALCCSINVFLALQDNPRCDLILSGGRYSRHNAFLTPIQRRSEFDAICFTKAFISAAGVDLKQGVTCFNFEESKAKQIAMAKSKQSILVVDHSKFGVVEQAYIADYADFDLCICDKPIPEAFR